MPQVCLTREQQRGYMLNKIIHDYLFDTGDTKDNLMRQMHMSTGTFYKRLREPETFSLGELWRLFDIMGVSPEQRAKILE